MAAAELSRGWSAPLAYLSRPRYVQAMATITQTGMRTISPSGKTIRIVDEMPGGWTVKYRFVREAGTYSLAEIHVKPSGRMPPGGLASRVWRGLAPLAALDAFEAERRRAEDWANEQARWEEASGLADESTRARRDASSEFFEKMRRSTGSMKATRARPGRRPRPDAIHAAAAERYIDLIATGRPIVELARELGLEPAGAADVIREARRKGLLTSPASPGKAGGILTPKARRILKGVAKRDGQQTQA